MLRTCRAHCAVAMSVCVIAGCQPHHIRLFSRKASLGTKATVNALPISDAAHLRKRISDLNGKVVLVDYWATWCPPCRAALPHTVELAYRHRDDGLAVITIALDDADDQAQVADFLRDNGADTENYLSRYGKQRQSFEEFHVEGGGIPYFQLYDRQGILRYSFTGASAEMDQRITELIAETGPGAG